MKSEKVYQKEYRQKNATKLRAYNLAYKKEHKEETAKARPEYRKKNQARIVKQVRERKFRSRYGISTAIYNLMLGTQEGCCAICEQMSDKPLFVDHCHKTGEVRGLLCKQCNFALGFFNDDQRILLEAINYLQTHERQRKLS